MAFLLLFVNFKGLMNYTSIIYTPFKKFVNPFRQARGRARRLAQAQPEVPQTGFGAFDQSLILCQDKTR